MVSPAVAASVSVNHLTEDTSPVMQETGDETEFQVKSMNVSEHGSVHVCYTPRAVDVISLIHKSQIRR